MNSNNIIPGLQIGHLSTPLPIIQGGMGVGISMAGLVAAVAAAGGIGVISAIGIGMREPNYSHNANAANRRALKREIEKARTLSAGAIGVNIMVALTDYVELLDASIDAKVDALFLGAGLPLLFSKQNSPLRIRELGIQIVPIVSSARATHLIFRYWAKKYGRVPDAVVVEGPLAGGHLGFKPSEIRDPKYQLEIILEEVAQITKSYEQQFGVEIPVIGAGGIYSGTDIFQIMQRGAAGVQMGTRFVATRECEAHQNFKDSYIQASEDDLVIISSPVGLPGRAIRNNFLKDVAAGKKEPVKCPWKCLATCDVATAPYCIAAALINAQKGNLKKGFPFAGANAYKVSEIVTVNELMDSLVQEYQDAASIWNQAASINISGKELNNEFVQIA
ncbi:MAG: nitronate monooxygenase [Candidatus Marinimicrobia bacterium]|nr:nitronate monooxygenase [FCB group bacterium]MBL7028250.1 nitronate monooxygenase [Candidatus Neomarinimicrobiota bacterium]